MVALKSFEYNEVKIEKLEDIYKYEQDFNKLYSMPWIGKNTIFQAFFRGQENALWEIQPSIVRNKCDEYEVYLRHQNKLKGKTVFSQVAYLQHYMTGTRFIDFTCSLDVALYFACKDSKDVDGAVFFCCYDAHKSEWYDTIVFTEIMMMKNKGEIKIKDFSKNLIKKYEEINNRFANIDDLSAALVSYLDFGYMVIPNEEDLKNNIRLNRQKGVFFITGVKFKETLTEEQRVSSRAGNNIFLSHSINVPDFLIRGNGLVKCIIPKELKEEILFDLNKKNINEKHLF